MSRLDRVIAEAVCAASAPPPPPTTGATRYRGVEIAVTYRGRRPIGYGPQGRYRSRREAAYAALLARPRERIVAGVTLRRRPIWGGYALGWEVMVDGRVLCTYRWPMAVALAREIGAFLAIPAAIDRAAVGRLPDGVSAPSCMAPLIELRRREIVVLRARRQNSRIVEVRREARHPDGYTMRLSDGRIYYIADGVAYPTRAAAMAAAAAQPDPDAPPNLGWRAWEWCAGRLISPTARTIWPEDGVLRAENWSDSGALRGCAGIHARRMPRNWRIADPLADPELQGYARYASPVIGIVEGWGRMVRGSEGWRAEYARILAVRVPSTTIGLAIERAYPSIAVYYDEEGQK